VDDALTSLAQEDGNTPDGGWPGGAPARDYLRSPAAARVGRFAHNEALFCFHFERRAPLELPDAWMAPGCEADAEVPGWHDGKLAERKHQSFRHDLIIGSFHPGHRGKWTTHELCHALIGYAWRPDASALFHACAARLAELLPVLLYYFFDEVRLTRCADHAGGGALYRQYCPACEDVARFRPIDPVFDRAKLEDGLRYLDRELAALVRTRRAGRPIAHRHGSLDLCSDGLRYARAHRRRLDSRSFAIWAELFDGPCSGRVPSLDALEDRVVRLTAALLGQGDWPARPVESPTTWARQDVAMRLLQVHSETDGDAATALLALAQALADDVPLGEVYARYASLAEDYVLPPSDVVWALGYSLEGVGGTHLPQIDAGLRSAAPLTMKLLAHVGVQPTPSFMAADPQVRSTIGARFARWLETSWPGPAAELARFEAAISSARADDTAAALATDTPNSDALSQARGFVVLTASRDPIALAEAVEQGAFDASVVDGQIVMGGDASACGLIVGRGAQGDLLLVGIDEATALALQQDDIAALPDSERSGLVQLGVLVPKRWPLDDG
jgi:hypothetical protein